MPIVRSYLADHANTLRDKAAVVDDRPGAPVTVWSFAELNRQANRLANLLLGLGVAPGEKVVCPAGEGRAVSEYGLYVTYDPRKVPVATRN